MNGLKLIRTICNYSQANLAEKLGVTRQAVNMWEHSKKPIPDSRKAEICELLGLEKAEWLDEVDEETMDIIRTHKLYQKTKMVLSIIITYVRTCFLIGYNRIGFLHC